MIRFWKLRFFQSRGKFFSIFFFILWNCPLFILFAAKISSHVSTIVSDIVVALKKIYNIVWKVANRKMHFDVVLPINYNLKNHLAKWLKKVFFFFKICWNILGQTRNFAEGNFVNQLNRIGSYMRSNFIWFDQVLPTLPIQF